MEAQAVNHTADSWPSQISLNEVLYLKKPKQTNSKIPQDMTAFHNTVPCTDGAGSEAVQSC